MNPAHPTATSGVTDPALAALLDEHWEAVMRRWPTWATQLGDHRYDDQMPDISPAGWAATRTGAKEWLARVEGIDTSGLNPADRITADVLHSSLSDSVANEVCHAEQWAISGFSNPFSEALGLTENHPVNTPEDGLNLVHRVRAFDTHFESAAANLRLGMESGRVASVDSVRRVIEMVSTELERPAAEQALIRVADAPHDDWTESDRQRFSAALHLGVSEVAQPAFTRFLQFLQNELLPLARPTERAGVSHLPDGAACYEATIREHTSLALSADTLHQMGIDALAEIHAEFSALGESLWGTSERSEIFTRLRTDPALYFQTGEEVKAKANEALARAKAAMPSTYSPAGPERPGQYFINLHAPTTRPRHEAEVLAFHEAIPGHHLQIAIAQEQAELPNVRRHFRSTAYVEGWALYTERLADEMGLYSSNVDRMGMLSFDAWRAARLVVDTGLHVKGWTRARAVSFMHENTPLAPNNIDNEVDRYLGWPGQALSYKVGQIEMWRLRREAEEALGERFDLAAWHDAVLALGAVPLPVLRTVMEGWIDARR
jgi:uncharacterized protein (DUF885 family)